MHFGFGDGSRLGAIVQTLIYLLGIPIIYDTINSSNNNNQTNRTNADPIPSVDPCPPQGLAAQDGVCYESLGCFKQRYSELKGYELDANPLEEIFPTICLYTKARLQACQVVDNEVITSSTLPVSNGSNFWVAHGYIENGQRPWVKHLVDELLEYDHFANVFVVDWSEGSTPPYNQAVENVELIAAYCANLMKMMQDMYGLKVDSTHFIGHSLGAQLAGYVGSWLQVNENLRLGRISGLDPAQLYFQGLPIDSRLDPTDGLFVDVIHTDAKPFLNGGEIVSKASQNISITSNTLKKTCTTDSSSSRCSSMMHTLNLGPVSGLGTQDQSGDIDFWPNGGKDQPGCKDGVYQAILQEEGSVINGIRRFLGCDHIRSYEYFTESIRSQCPYMAFVCDSWEDFVDSKCSVTQFNRLGFHATKPFSQNDTGSSNTSVSYYSITGSRQPFCREHYRVTVHLSEESTYRSTSELHLVLANDTNGQSTVLNLGPTDFTDKGVERKYTVSGVNTVVVPDKLILRPSSSNPLRWLGSRGAAQVQPDVVVKEIKLLHLESGAAEMTFCPESGKNFFSGSDQNPSIILRTDQCVQ